MLKLWMKKTMSVYAYSVLINWKNYLRNLEANMLEFLWKRNGWLWLVEELNITHSLTLCFMKLKQRKLKITVIFLHAWKSLKVPKVQKVLLTKGLRGYWRVYVPVLLYLLGTMESTNGRENEGLFKGVDANVGEVGRLPRHQLESIVHQNLHKSKRENPFECLPHTPRVRAIDSYRKHLCYLPPSLFRPQTSTISLQSIDIIHVHIFTANSNGKPRSKTNDRKARPRKIK
jgi:hypothetical protein